MAETAFAFPDMFGSHPQPITWDLVENGDILVIKVTYQDQTQYDTVVLLEKTGNGGWFCRLSCIEQDGRVADGGSGISLSGVSSNDRTVELTYCGTFKGEDRRLPR